MSVSVSDSGLEHGPTGSVVSGSILPDDGRCWQTSRSAARRGSVLTERLPGVRTFVLGLAIILAAGASGALGEIPPDCSRLDSGCTLAATAEQADFLLGAAIEDPAGVAEASLLPGNFNALTAENRMKWGELAPRVGQYDFSRADRIAAYAQEQGWRLRGHTLVWHNQLPTDLEAVVMAAPDPAVRLRELIDEHVRTVVGRYRGVVPLWDVVNEPLDTNSGRLGDTPFTRLLGEEYIDQAFRTAHEVDPRASLFLNEFLLGYSGSKANGLLALVRRLKERGVPLDGVGVQAHFYPVFPLPTPAQFEGYLRALAELGVQVELTELDISLRHFEGAADPLAEQGRYFGEIVRACLAAGCRAVTLWGLHDGDTWLDHQVPFEASAPNRPLLFDADLRPKPARQAVQAALALAAPRFFDCNGDRFVTVDEILRGVNIALDLSPLATCPSFDPGRNGRVTIDELVAAVERTLAD